MGSSLFRFLHLPDHQPLEVRGFVWLPAVSVHRTFGKGLAFTPFFVVCVRSSATMFHFSRTTEFHVEKVSRARPLVVCRGGWRVSHPACADTFKGALAP